MALQKKTRRVALLGMLFAVSVVLSIVEGLLPIPMPAPGVKMGLGNIAVMYALLFLGLPDALGLAVLKGLFALVTRGAIAGLLSMAGSVLSVLVMAGLGKLSRGKASVFLLSVAGALGHNAGQLAAVTLVYPSLGVLGYAPVLAVSGAAAGFITALVLRAFLPMAKRLGFKAG